MRDVVKLKKDLYKKALNEKTEEALEIYRKANKEAKREGLGEMGRAVADELSRE